MKIFEHRGAYDAQRPVLVYTKKFIQSQSIRKKIEGVAKQGRYVLNVGDVIISNYIAENAISQNQTDTLPIRNWEVIEILDRNTPKGNFIVDVENTGFTAIVEPASTEKLEEMKSLGIKI